MLERFQPLKSAGADPSPRSQSNDESLQSLVPPRVGLRKEEEDFPMCTILRTCLSKWSEQNGRLDNITLSELLSVSLVQEADSWFSFS